MNHPRYTLKSADEFRWFMANPGTGIPYTVRTLADRTGCGPGLIQKLASGKQSTASVLDAHAFVEAFGCSILNLFAPPVTPKRVTATTENNPEEE